jgi:hypothetical protein
MSTVYLSLRNAASLVRTVIIKLTKRKVWEEGGIGDGGVEGIYFSLTKEKFYFTVLPAVALLN